MMALEVMSRDSEASVDPVPERLRNKRCLMDWSEVRDTHSRYLGSVAMHASDVICTCTVLSVMVGSE